jgi:hypothetical protein
MALAGWAVLGMVIGAAGSEVLRVLKRELVEKVENAASRFVDSLCSSKSHDNEAGEAAD